MMSQSVVTPAIIIELSVESAPQVRLRAMREDEELRILDWIDSHPALRELVQRALELAQEASKA